MAHLPVPPDLASRLMSQLRTFPPGHGRSAAQVAAGMHNLSPADAEHGLRLLHSQLLVLRDQPPRGEALYRLG
jgi:hypothetical protein